MGIRVRLAVAAVLLLACAGAFGRVGPGAAPDCAPLCPVESIVAAPSAADAPCLRDPACGGAAAASALALIALPVPLRFAAPAPLGVARRPRRPRTTAGRGAADPPTRPPAAG